LYINVLFLQNNFTVLYDITSLSFYYHQQYGGASQNDKKTQICYRNLAIRLEVV